MRIFTAIKNKVDGLVDGVVSTGKRLYKSTREDNLIYDALKEYKPTLIARANRSFSDSMFLKQDNLDPLLINEIKRTNKTGLCDYIIDYGTTKGLIERFEKIKVTCGKAPHLDDPEDNPAPSIVGDPPSEEYKEGAWSIEHRMYYYGVKAPLVSLDTQRFPDYQSVRSYLDEITEIFEIPYFGYFKELIYYIDEQIFLANRAGGRFIRIDLYKLPPHLHFLLSDESWWDRIRLYRYYRNDGFEVSERFYVGGGAKELMLYMGW